MTFTNFTPTTFTDATELRLDPQLCIVLS